MQTTMTVHMDKEGMLSRRYGVSVSAVFRKMTLIIPLMLYCGLSMAVQLQHLLWTWALPASCNASLSA